MYGFSQKRLRRAYKFLQNLYKTQKNYLRKIGYFFSNLPKNPEKGLEFSEKLIYNNVASKSGMHLEACFGRLRKGSMKTN